MSQRLYFEDLSEGQVFEAGPFELTQARIIEFATEFDPQPQHIDPEAAKTTSFDGLAASGWHTAAATMRLMHEALIHRFGESMGLGIEGLKWSRPVRPGDLLTTTVTIGAKRLSSSKPGFGIVPLQIRTVDQDSHEVLRMTSGALIRTRGA